MRLKASGCLLFRHQVSILALVLFPAIIPAQTLSVLSGDGQITTQNFQANYPLVVVAKDASGKPLAGVPVNWSISGPGTLVPGGQTVTGPDGQTSNRFVGATIYGDTAFTQSIVTASTANSSVNMHVTTSGTDLTSGSVFVQANVISPNIGDTLSDVGTAPVVQVQVSAVHQAGVQQVPNVSVRLIPDNTTGPSLACAPGTALTDANGAAHCQVVFSGPIGNGSFSIEVGGFRTFSPFLFSVTHSTAQPAAIVITGGNNQSGLPGAQLPQPLTARVQDAAGNPLPNVPVVWQPVNSQSVSLSSVVSTSDANGIVSAIARLGSVVGPAQVQLRTASGAAQTTFNLTVSQTQTGPGGTPASFRITGGNNQTGPAGSRLPTPLTAQVVDAKGNPVSNVSVVWQPLNPQSVSLSGVVSTSDANGFVTAIATLGSVIGPAQVQLRTTGAVVQTPFGPAGAAIQAAFNLTVAQPRPAALRIVSGNNQSGPPGSRLPAPLTAQVVDAVGNPLPNSPVSWQPANPQAVSLSGVVSTSDANGIVSAVATLGSAVGPAQVQLSAANGAVQIGFSLTVSQPQPANLRIISGNNQSGPPGAPLSAPLTARVEDASGNPVPNVTVVWQAVIPQSVALSSVTVQSDANGLVSAIATLAPGAATAQVQVRVANAPVQTVFVLQAALVLTGIGIVTGSNQQTAPGGSFAQPITVQVSTSGAPAAGLQVQFTNSGAPVSISNGGLALTDANGRATVSVQAGSVTGTAIITAAIGNFSTSVSLTIQAAQPALSFLNGASGQSSPISPAEVLSIYGTGIAPGIDGCVPANQAVGPLLFSLSGVTVQFASQGYSSSAPLFSVCNFGPGQESVTVEVPADLPVVDTTVTVQVGDSIVAQTTTPAASVSPGIFETAMSDGVKRALLRRSDGTFVSLESPAQAGERLQAFVTGLGKPVTASGIAIATNQAGISGDDAAAPNPVTIGIADRVLQPVSAIYATDMIGVYVLTFDMPTDAPSGSDVAFTVTTLLDGQSVIGDSTKIPIQ